jgi:hypothetical protein
MVRERKTEHEETGMCRGYTGSPKGRRRRQDCHHIFHVKMSVKYKQEPEAPQSGEATEKA